LIVRKKVSLMDFSLVLKYVVLMVGQIVSQMGLWLARKKELLIVDRMQMAV